MVRAVLRTLRQIVGATILAMLILQLSGCGTILYPERRNQAAGKLDTDVVLLDGIGLLFFLIPGVIAFAVDFATGAIYLPKGGRSRALDAFGEVRAVPFDRDHVEAHDISALVARETGLEIDLGRGRSWELADVRPDEVISHVREANLAIARARRPAL